MRIRRVRLEVTESTNSWLKERRGELEMPVAVTCRAQTAGRGQRGNSWESEPGMNLTLSLLFRPAGVDVREQFRISQAVALAVADFLFLRGVDAKIKWPNDIYVGDLKICGILIENSILGREIDSSVAGLGLNLNQRTFLSDAPNPVSLIHLTGEETDPDTAADDILRHLSERLHGLDSPEGRLSLHRDFLERLWRNDGLPHPFLDRRDGSRFSARIHDVDPDGTLTLETSAPSQLRRFLFKEVAWLPEHSGQRFATEPL